MKLKKIASLMLAGVMAVSMLTACDTTSNDQPNVPNQPEEPTASDVVSAVEAGIASWNSDLEITVKNSDNMDAAIEKLFDSNFDSKTNELIVQNVIEAVFNKNIHLRNDNFLNRADRLNDDDRKDGTDLYTYAIIPVTQASGDANVYAGNEIGKALKDVENTFKDESTWWVTDDFLSASYTMYVCSEDAVMANNSVTTYVVAVLVSNYSTVA